MVEANFPEMKRWLDVGYPRQFRSFRTFPRDPLVLIDPKHVTLIVQAPGFQKHEPGQVIEVQA